MISTKETLQVKSKISTQFSSYFDWLQIPPGQQAGFARELLGFVFVVVLIMLFDVSGFKMDVLEGRPAPRTIRSPKAISFFDERRTNELRKIEEERVEPVLIYIENAEAAMLERFDAFLEEVREFRRQKHGQETIDLNSETIQGFFGPDPLLNEDQLFQILNISQLEFNRLRANASQILNNVIQVDITDDNIDTVKNEVRKSVDAFPGSNVTRSLTTSMIRNVLSVKAVVDQKQTRERRETAANSVRPVKRSFQKGQKIIDEGVIVTADDVYVLRVIEKEFHRNQLLTFLGNLLLTGLLLMISLSFLHNFSPQVIKSIEQRRLLFGLWIMGILLAKIVYATGAAYDQADLAILLTPLPGVALLLAILLNPQTALFHVTILGMMMFIIAEANTRFALVSILGGLIGVVAWASSTCDKNLRSSIGGSGTKIGLANAVALLAAMLLDAENYAMMTIYGVSGVIGAGLLNGFITGVAVNGLLPYIETFFAMATSSRLLELADLSQPLMKRMAEEAPGTYQHSIAVASLSEAAATEINANALLAKIGGYYHDIGKLKRPSYFVENQSSVNHHDHLTPYMSSLILVGHIRDGVDLAVESSLPERIQDLIKQHHGTTLITFFYDLAKRGSDGHDVQVSEERFRYPCPKPQTKEAAILMLADAVEAAARTLKQYSHNRIEALVQKIVENKLNDENQLDESDLTLKDIEKIQQTFVRVLTSMYHGRIDYPGKLSNQEGTG